MDNILARNSVDATPTVAVTMVASQQQRARRKAAMSADAAAAAAREDLMLAPDDDDNNNNFEGAGGCPQASAAASVNHKRLFNPRASLNVGQSPPVAAAVAQRLNGFSSSFSSSVPAVSNSCAGSSDARGDYGSSASGGNSNGKHDSNSNSHNSKKKTALSAHAVEYLKNWMMSPDHIDHPYPTEDEKLRIMNETGIVLKQLTNWFVNNRKRYWKPKVEELKRRQSGDTGGGAGEGAGSPQETAEVSVDQGGGGVAATTMTVAMRKKNVDGKDGGESSQSQREEVNRRPPPSILSSGNVGGGKRRKKNPTPASDDDDNTSNDDASARRAKKAREEVARYPTITNPMMPMITATVASTSAGVATDASHESVQEQSRMKMTRTYANCSHTSVVSEESAEEGRGADGGGEGGGGSGTEDENGDDTYEVRNVAVSDSLLVNDTHAFVTSADARSLPPSLNAINSKSGLLQASHQQVMMMIDMEYSINPLDMDDSDDDLIQNNTSVERTICCSSVLPHSCTDPKNRYAQPCALCSACRDWNLGQFCPWDLTGIIGDISVDNMMLEDTPQDPSTAPLSSSEDNEKAMSLTSLVTSSSGSSASSSEDGSSAHYETSSTEEGGTTVVTKNSTVADDGIEPTMMAMYSNFSVPQEISHSTSAADFMSSMADIESWY